ncbi:MAG: siderophore-interacting protein [Legionellales bacterium]|nr:siderophore-interacting protein [Legionellales bacterium]
MPIKTFPVTVSWAKMLSKNVRHLSFKLDGAMPLNFIPGQFINIHIEHDNRTLSRSYSIATRSELSQEIEIAASFVEGGIASDYLAGLQEGDRVTMSGPFGRLILRDEQPQRYFLIATGTGVTPYRAMLATLAKRDVETFILYGCRTSDDCLYGEEFAEFCQGFDHLSYHACYSREMPENPQAFEHAGYVQDYLMSFNLSPTQDVIYLCGNPNMIDDTYERLKLLEFNPQSVRREKYISNN